MRYCLESDLQSFEKISESLGFVAKRNPVKGYGSTGALGEIDGEETFLRVPNTKSTTETHDVLLQYGITGALGVIGVYATDHLNHLVQLPYAEPPNVNRFEWARSIPTRPKSAAMVLKPLPYNDSLTKVINSGDTKRAEAAYFAFGRKLRFLHSTELPSEQDSSWWKLLSTKHIISGRERFDDIVTHIDPTSGWSDLTQIRRIRAKATIELDNMSTLSLPITRTHYDAWRENVVVNSDGSDVELFDPALAYGSPGCDFAFAIGDQLLGYLASGDTDALSRIHKFESGYGGRELLLAQITPFLSFKCVVGAAFDEYDIEQKSKIVRFSEKLLNASLENKKLKYDLDVLCSLWGDL